MITDMKRIQSPIQIANGYLSCPHCAGEMSVLAVALRTGTALPTFTCRDCKAASGVLFQDSDSGVTVEWVEIPHAAQEAIEEVQALEAEDTPTSNRELN